MKKWKVVRRLTPKQKGESLKRLGNGYDLAKNHEYVILYNDEPSDYILRRCPHCGYVDVWTVNFQHLNIMVCEACGKQSETT